MKKLVISMNMFKASAIFLFSLFIFSMFTSNVLAINAPNPTILHHVSDVGRTYDYINLGFAFDINKNIGATYIKNITNSRMFYTYILDCRPDLSNNPSDCWTVNRSGVVSVLPNETTEVLVGRLCVVYQDDIHYNGSGTYGYTIDSTGSCSSNVQTPSPTVRPTQAPTPRPTATPTLRPTSLPTPRPTATPTLRPTSIPTLRPTFRPTARPTATPTLRPTLKPTSRPTVAPSVSANCKVDLFPKKISLSTNKAQSFLAVVNTKGTVNSVDFSSSDTNVANITPSIQVPPLYYAQVTANNLGNTSISVSVTLSNGATCSDSSNVSTTPSSPWWQAIGDVFSNRDLQSNIPSTCSLPSCDPNLIISGPGGLIGNVIYGSTTNLDKNNISPKGWIGNATYLGKVYDYSYFSSVASASITFNSIGAAITQADLDQGNVTNEYYYYRSNGSTSINSNITIPGNKKVVLFIKGDLNIHGRINIVNVGQGFFMAIVSGNINIDPNVTSQNGPALEGLYEADGIINTGASSNPLYVKGTMVGWRGFSLNRNLNDNTQTPAETFEYSPYLTILFPRDLTQDILSWQEILP